MALPLYEERPRLADSSSQTAESAFPPQTPAGWEASIRADGEGLMNYNDPEQRKWLDNLPPDLEMIDNTPDTGRGPGQAVRVRVRVPPKVGQYGHIQLAANGTSLEELFAPALKRAAPAPAAQAPLPAEAPQAAGPQGEVRKQGAPQRSLEEIFAPVTNPHTGVSMVPPPVNRERASQTMLRDPAVDYTRGPPQHVRYNAERASLLFGNELERYLVKTYGKDNVRLEGGQWLVKGLPEIQGRVPPSRRKEMEEKQDHIWMPLWPDNDAINNTGATVAAGVPPIAGGAAGFALGGPMGALGGAMLGTGADEGIKAMQGFYDKSPLELAATMGAQGVSNALPFMSAFPGGMRNTGTMAAANIARRYGGVTPEAQATGTELAARGVHPPIWSVAPDLKIFGYDSAQRRKLGGDPWFRGRQELLETDASALMQRRGFSPQEVEQNMNWIKTPSEGAPPTQAGELINQVFVNRDRALERESREMLDAAHGRLTSSLNEYTRNMTRSPGNIGGNVNEFFKGWRRQFYGDIGQVYDGYHNAVGGAAIVDPSPVFAEAAALARDNPAIRQSPIVRRLMGDRVDLSDPAEAELMHDVFGAQAETDGPVGLLTLKEGHQLRTALREAAPIGDLRAPGQHAGELRRLARVADDALNNARSPEGIDLKPMLNAADRQYAEGAKIINDEGINQLYRDVRAGKTPAAGDVADVILDRKSPERMRSLYDMLPGNLQTAVQRADNQNLFRDSGGLGANERYQLDPERFIDNIDARRDIWRHMYGSDAMWKDMRRLAQEFRAVNGSVDISELATLGQAPSPRAREVRGFLERSLGAQRALGTQADNDPIGALKADNPQLIQQGVNWMLANPSRTRQVMTALLRDPSPEAAAALHAIERETTVRLFKGSMHERQPGQMAFSATALEGGLSGMTAEQQMYTLGANRDDFLRLIRYTKTLLPEMENGFSGGWAAGQTMSQMQHDPKKGIKRYITSRLLGAVADDPNLVGLLVGTIRQLPEAKRADWLRYMIQGGRGQAINVGMSNMRRNEAEGEVPDISERLRRARDTGQQQQKDADRPRYQGIGGQ